MIRFIPYACLILLANFQLSGCEPDPQVIETDERPNIVLLVADDLGYSDLGCMGGEISTPNIDQLGGEGQFFSNFYTAATCSPTRAMILTGVDHHIAGLGNMAERVVGIPQQLGQPGYEGYLNQRVVSVAQLLKDRGYHTYTAGKWHLGVSAEHSPETQGFERSFTLMEAYADHFNPHTRYRTFWKDHGFAPYPAGVYSTDHYTDQMISFIEDRQDQRPFFLYAAFTSPHWPLQVPEEFSDRYRGKYDIGYDSLRVLRFEKLVKHGILPQNSVIPELPPIKGALYSATDQPLLPWKSLSDQQQIIESRKMEIYAGMVENLDHNIGRLIEYFKDNDLYHNTLWIFISDNGAAVLDLNETPDPRNPLPYMGGPNSFVAYGPPWAHASSAGFRLYKGYATEGGIRSPMIVKLPFQNQGRGLVKAFTSVKDLVPTILDIAGIDYPNEYQGRSITPLQGRSLLPFLKNTQDQIHPDEYVMGWELFGRYALRKGQWKITQVEPPLGTGNFALFNLEEDPLETRDLAKTHPGKYHELLREWQRYLDQNGVILLD